MHGLKTVGVSILFAVATISLPFQSASATLTIPEIQGQVGKPTSSWDASSVSALESSLLKNSQQQQQQQQEAREGGNSNILLESSPSIQIKRSPRYWDAIKSGDPELIHESNEKLVDYIIGTTNTMYYDITGGYRFSVPCMNDNWKMFLKEMSKEGEEDPLSSRESTVKGIKTLVATIGDPYSKYLTREELLDELSTDSSRKDGFLGLGALVEPPSLKVSMMNSRIKYYSTSNNPMVMQQSLSQQQEQKTTAFVNPFTTKVLSSSSSSSSSIISLTRGENLPVVIAVSPDSPAERAGLVVGDRIASIGYDKFIGMSQNEVTRALSNRYNAENYAGSIDLVIAKPFLARTTSITEEEEQQQQEEAGEIQIRQVSSSSKVPERPIGYRLSKVRLTTASLSPFRLYDPSLTTTQQQHDDISSSDTPSDTTKTTTTTPPSAVEENKENTVVFGGSPRCHYELLGANDSILYKARINNNDSSSAELVGYIRLTRFSRSTTTDFLEAIDVLEKNGANSYIIDLRNNAGGVIQEAMLLASSLLRDPSTVLCYTLNSRGGFTPHDVEEYIVDKRYPGYLLSSEDKGVSLSQLRRDNPDIFSPEDGRWLPPSQFASLHEQRTKRGTHREDNSPEVVKKQQKKIVLLINEGTASSSEVFASSLRDNGRLVAVVGTRSYGKGVIQHTFPTPDGGGLRITVAEYLTPALKHVTKIMDAQLDENGIFVGGGITPDIYCSSELGIPSNPGADLCVASALDALTDQDNNFSDVVLADSIAR